MEKIAIKGLNLFGKAPSVKNEQKSATQTNPFGVSFKGNIIQADVFESSKKPSMNFEGFKGKLSKSAFVGAIASLSESFKTRYNSVREFAQRVMERPIAFFKRAQETQINADTFKSLGESLKTAMARVKESFKDPYKGKSVDELRAMLGEEIAALAV